MVSYDSRVMSSIPVMSRALQRVYLTTGIFA